MTPQTQAHVIENGAHILSKIGHVREKTSRVGISAKTLQSTPYTRQGSEESEEPGMRRVTLCRVVPIIGVETEEEFDVLFENQLLIPFYCSRILTPRAYVSEQNMSPRKKSLNSTGNTPARDRRHCVC
jgi:hypothetical protein